MSKRIMCIMPVDWVTGNLSGRQFLTYTEADKKGWGVADGQIAAANNYQSRLIAKRVARTDKRYFQVRTCSSVHMTVKQRMNLAVTGGAGALFGALVKDKTAPIYIACASVCPRRTTMRQFVFPLIRQGLQNKDERIIIAANIYIINPWTSAEEPNIAISADIIDKFAAILS